MTWTTVSCCLVCSHISWFTCYLISHISFMVAVPLSHFIASPKKGIRLLLDCGFSGGDMFSESVLSNCPADHMVGCRICRCCLCWRIHLEEHWVKCVMLAVGLGVSLVVGEPRTSDGWTYVVVCLSHPVICGLWFSMNGVLGRPLELDEITQTDECGYPFSFLLRSLWGVDWKGWFLWNKCFFFNLLVYR